MNLIKVNICSVKYHPYDIEKFAIRDINKYYLNADKIKYFTQYTVNNGITIPVPGVTTVYLETGDSLLLHIDAEELANELLGLNNNIDNKNID